MLLTLLFACTDDTSLDSGLLPDSDAGQTDSGIEEPADADGDGFVEDDDCDDDDPAVNPDASEVCDGVDNDCDGTVDQAAEDMTTWYTDADGDGFGDSESPIQSCDQPSDAVPDASDCDDEAAWAFPGGTEVCDRADNDCDGTADFDGWIGEDHDSLAALAASGVEGHFCLDVGTISESGITTTAALHIEGAGVDATFLDASGGTVFTPEADLTLSNVTVTGLTEPVIESDNTTSVTLQSIRFDAPSPGENGTLVYLDEGELTVRDVLVEGAVLELTSNWYGLFYLEAGTFTVQGLDVWDGSFTGTSHSYGTLYHGEGDVLLEDVHVWDNQFDFYQSIYGLIFCEEDGYGDQIHRRSSAVNNTVTTGTSFYGSYSLDDVDDFTVVLENIRLVGNTLQSASERSNYGWLGYVDNEGSTTVHNLVIAGNHDDGSGKATLVSSFGYAVDAQNWDIAHNTASETSSEPMIQLPGDWTVRNWNVVDNGFGTDFSAGILAGGSLDIDYVNWDESTTDGAFVDTDGEVTVTNLWSVDPLYTDPGTGDMTLQESSPVIDVGDPSILDWDGSASDIGAHGGPLGDSW